MMERSTSAVELGGNVAGTPGPIEPARVTRPFQLLAAWLVALLSLSSAFLIAARTIEKPSWAAGFLIIVAVALVPLFLACMFLLQTKFRPQMQEDKFFFEYFKEQQKANALTNELRKTMADAGLTTEAMALGKSLQNVSNELRSQIKGLADRAQQTVDELQNRSGQPSNTNPAVALELGKAFAAEGRWLEAAHQLDQYVVTNPSDWQTQFLRGVVYINSRDSTETNLQGLRAYNEALAFADERIDPNLRARLHAYRGAALKRLHRLDEAESELLFARRFAMDSYEITDIASNLAGVYALAGDREKMLDEVRKIKQAPTKLSKEYIAGIQSHLGDYFSEFKNDSELMSLLNTI